MLSITHQEPQTGQVWITYRRDNWREYVSFYCHPDYIMEFRKAPFAWLYISFEDNSYSTMNRQMVIAPIALFVAIGRGVKWVWWTMARAAWRAGYLNPPEEGGVVHWFWLRYLTLHRPPSK